jgi:hypothetical protein
VCKTFSFFTLLFRKKPTWIVPVSYPLVFIKQRGAAQNKDKSHNTEDHAIFYYWNWMNSLMNCPWTRYGIPQHSYWDHWSPILFYSILDRSVLILDPQPGQRYSQQLFPVAHITHWVSTVLTYNLFQQNVASTLGWGHTVQGCIVQGKKIHGIENLRHNVQRHIYQGRIVTSTRKPSSNNCKPAFLLSLS